MVIAITGNRPGKLHGYGYDYTGSRWRMAVNQFIDVMRRYHCTEAVTGMALGTDTAFALAVLEMKKAGDDIKLVCAVPCLEQDAKWHSNAKVTYADILAQADDVVTVTPERYRSGVMQKRNEYIVDRADMLLAFWNGEPGGTANAVAYAKEKGKKILFIDPDNVTVQTEYNPESEKEYETADQKKCV